MPRQNLTIACLLATALLASAPAEDPAEDSAARGYRWLRTRPYLPADFDQAVRAYEAAGAHRLVVALGGDADASSLRALDPLDATNTERSLEELAGRLLDR